MNQCFLIADATVLYFYAPAHRRTVELRLGMYVLCGCTRDDTSIITENCRVCNAASFGWRWVLHWQRQEE